jgi:hypothetical protein
MTDKKKVGLQPGHWGPQHGSHPKSIAGDKMVTAMKPGLRVSKTGHEYWEYRFDRTDKSPKKKI